MIKDEDVAHIVTRGSTDAVVNRLTTHFSERSYRRLPVKSRVHLLKTVDWESPFDPPPQYRCFVVIEEADGWTTIVDELDRLDMNLARSLSLTSHVIAAQGYYQLQEFYYTILIDGREVRDSQVPPDVAAIVENIRRNPDHLTKFNYDEIVLRLGDQRYQVIGFARA